MREFQQIAIEHACRLASAGRALDTLTNLMGVDGNEHNLSRDDITGLKHAVRAIAGYVSAASLAIYEAAEMRGEQEVSQ